MKFYEFPIKPMPKPRMTRADAWKSRPCVVKYWEFKEHLLYEAKKLDFKLGNAFHVKLAISMPKSWSEKKKFEMMGCPHDGKGDIDNFVKAIMDCMLKQDKTVYKIIAEKYWSHDDAILLANLE